MHIGTKIRQLRKENKDTLKSLAEKIGYDNSNLSKIESGKIDVTIELLQKIMNVYNVDSSYFFGAEKRIKIDDVEVSEEELKHAVRLIRYTRNLK